MGMKGTQLSAHSQLGRQDHARENCGSTTWCLQGGAERSPLLLIYLGWFIGNKDALPARDGVFYVLCMTVSFHSDQVAGRSDLPCRWKGREGEKGFGERCSLACRGFYRRRKVSCCYRCLHIAPLYPVFKHLTFNVLP